MTPEEKVDLITKLVDAKKRQESQSFNINWSVALNVQELAYILGKLLQ